MRTPANKKTPVEWGFSPLVVRHRPSSSVAVGVCVGVRLGYAGELYAGASLKRAVARRFDSRFVARII
jgi:hypothetical protein